MVIRLQMIKDEVLNFANKNRTGVERGPRLERGNRRWRLPAKLSASVLRSTRVQPTFIQLIRLEMGGKKTLLKTIGLERVPRIKR